MFLRNYDNYLIAIHTSSQKDYVLGNSSSDFGEGSYNQKTPSGACERVYYTSISPILLFNAYGICLGDGNRAVTYEDYKLSGNVVENRLVDVSTTREYDAETKKWRMKYIGTYNNPGDTDITISEWGLYRNNHNFSFTVSFDNTSKEVALVFREVLETPIVIEAGTTATLTFTLDIPMPNHP